MPRFTRLVRASRYRASQSTKQRANADKRQDWPLSTPFRPIRFLLSPTRRVSSSNVSREREREKEKGRGSSPLHEDFEALLSYACVTVPIRVWSSGPRTARYSLGSSSTGAQLAWPSWGLEMGPDVLCDQLLRFLRLEESSHRGSRGSTIRSRTSKLRAWASIPLYRVSPKSPILISRSDYPVDLWLK